MFDIQSIIIYNGGSAGDFLKAVCNQQLFKSRTHLVNERGFIEFRDYHFKLLIESLYKGHALDTTHLNVNPVENTHYYLDGMQQLTTNLFFIDYPDHLHDFVINRMCHTRYKGDLSRVYDLATQYLPDALRHKLTKNDTYAVLRSAYQRNLNLWRQNTVLRPILIRDIMLIDRLESVVKQLCGIDSIDKDMLSIAHAEWLEKNPDLPSKFI